MSDVTHFLRGVGSVDFCEVDVADVVDISEMWDLLISAR